MSLKLSLSVSTWAKLTLGGIATCLFLACSPNEYAGGGSDHPNEITGVVANIDAQPVAAAKVFLYSKAEFGKRTEVHRTSQDFTLIDSALTDIEGKFKFTGMDTGNFSIEAAYKGENQISSQVSYEDSIIITKDEPIYKLPALTLYYGGTIKGIIQSQDLTLEHVELAGTPYHAKINEDGSFIFKDLPPGAYGLLSFYKDNENNSGASINMAGRVVPDSIVDLGTLTVSKDQLLLEDFEFNDNRAITGYLYGGGWWFGVGGGEYIANPSLPGFPVDESTDVLGNNRLFHATWDFLSPDPEKSSNYYVFGFNIGYGFDGYLEGAPAELSYFDFSQVDKIAFKAKGSGTFRLQIGTRAIKESPVNEVAHYGVEFTLDPSQTELQDIVIDLSTIDIGPVEANKAEYVKDINWTDARKEVYAISFVVNNDAEIWLDDIHIIDYNINYFE